MSEVPNTDQTGADAARLRPEVLSPDGVAGPGDRDAEGPNQDDPSAEIESPAKIIRIGAMVKQLLEEVRNTELDEASRDQLRDIYDNSVAELKEALSPELADELDALSFDFSSEDLPTGTELRLAKAQLVGWLEGVFHGIQATLVTQQMAMRQQLEGMRGQLPEGGQQGPGGPGYL